MPKNQAKYNVADNALLLLIGNNIKYLRLKNNKSQKQCAAYLDLTPSTFSRIESGLQATDVLTVKKLCDFLNCKPNDLYTKELVK